MTNPGSQADALFLQALQHHQAGRIAEAEALYRRALEVNPRHPDSLQNLGIILVQAGQLPAAIEMLSRAIEVNPNASHYHANLGEALSRAGRHEEALATLRRALALDPRNFNACLNLALLLNSRGRMEETLAVCQQALGLNPNHPTLLKVQGDACLLANREEEARRTYEHLLRVDPAAHDARFNLGHAYLKLGRLNEAISCFRGVIAASPTDAAAHYQLGELLARQGLIAESIGTYEMAMRLDPRDDLAPAGLGSALKNLSRVDEAIVMYERALAINPQAAVTRANLANTLRDAGLIDQAIAHFRGALETAPDQAAIRSGLILTLYLHPEQCGESVEIEKAAWNERHAAPLAPKILSHASSRDPSRPLRIGYVSADLRNHPVSRFMLPILAHHDRANFEAYCYFNHQAPDDITAVLRQHPKVWREVAHLTDERLAEMIREDRIDILIDLNMHTIGNRLTMFALKPAPVQISYLAYTDGPGLSAIDYRLTDPYLEGGRVPDSASRRGRGEAPLMLPETYWCYVTPTSPLGAPALPSPDVPPAVGAGRITFGSLNYFSKLTPEAIRLWARLLMQVSDSRLILHVPEGGSQERTRALFGAEGVGAERLTLQHRVVPLEYFKLYTRIDIALDTFPYAGGTTSCDALFMGVPVVTLAGSGPTSRGGVSILSNLGLPELIAHSTDEYVAIAAGLAGDLERLKELRSTLRARLQQSPLMNIPRFVRNIEAAYRTAWARWCAGS